MNQNEEGHIPAQIGRYTLRGTIGTGAFSIVKLAVDMTTQKSYACKIVPRSKISKPRQEARFELEIRILQQMRHPNIVQLYDILKDTNNYYVIQEFCSNGELFQHIIDNRFLSENDAKAFLKQLISALVYIHANRTVHRDLKPENLLLDDFGQLKVSDFGFARFEDKDQLVTTPCGSPCYASPECLDGGPYDGKKSDIWSCGVILFAMVTGQLPWTKKNQHELFKQIKAGEYTIPTYLSEECKDLISKMLSHEPNDRPTAADVMEHAWIKDAKYLLISNSPVSNITLKKIDRYFCRELSNFVPVQLKRRSMSMTGETYEKVVKCEIIEYNENDSRGNSKLPQLANFGKRKEPPSAVEMVKRHKLQILAKQTINGASEKSSTRKPGATSQMGTATTTGRRLQGSSRFAQANKKPTKR